MTISLMWGQYPAFGPPFVDETCRIDLPGATVLCRDLSANTRFLPGSYTWPVVPARAGGDIDLR